MMSVKQAVYTAPPPTLTECRNCGEDVPKMSYRAHLDAEGDTRSFHVCGICDRGLATTTTLADHQYIHDLTKPFECGHDGCNKGYNTAVCLELHIRTHDLDFQGSTCEECHKVYKNGKDLVVHMLAHDEDTASAVQCPHCDRTFAKQYLCTAHQYVHEPDRPYKCSHEGCQKDFKRRQNFPAKMGVALRWYLRL
jgi:KRAB domain-containing zinc finger protein